MRIDDSDRSLNYKETLDKVLSELERLNRIYLATSYNDIVHGWYPLCVFNGIKAYIILLEKMIWVKQIERNPNVTLNTIDKQILGKARILGDPHDHKNWKAKLKFKERHRMALDRCVNIPKLVLIEVKISHITLMEYYGLDHPAFWKVTHIDVEKKEAFWHYLIEDYPYWHQIAEKATPISAL